jgi:hypothetical protein
MAEPHEGHPVATGKILGRQLRPLPGRAWLEVPLLVIEVPLLLLNLVSGRRLEGALVRLLRLQARLVYGYKLRDSR